MKWHIVRGKKKISLLWNNYLRWWTEGGLREHSQQWPYLSPLPSLSVIGSGLMNDRGGAEKGEGWLPKPSKPAQCEEDKRLLCVSYWRVAWSEGGDGAWGWREGVCMGSVETEMYTEGGLRSEWVALGRVCCWHPAPMNMYVPLFTCSKDGPPG